MSTMLIVDLIVRTRFCVGFQSRAANQI